MAQIISLPTYIHRERNGNLLTIATAAPFGDDVAPSDVITRGRVIAIEALDPKDARDALIAKIRAAGTSPEDIADALLERGF